MKSPYQIIRKPVITEKGLAVKETEGTLVFQVAPDATKTEIKQAVQKIFKVKVDAVQTANFTGKERRRGRYTGFRPDWKKAYVKLKAGEPLLMLLSAVRRRKARSRCWPISSSRPERSMVDGAKWSFGTAVGITASRIGAWPASTS